MFDPDQLMAAFESAIRGRLRDMDDRFEVEIRRPVARLADLSRQLADELGARLQPGAPALLEPPSGTAPEELMVSVAVFQDRKRLRSELRLFPDTMRALFGHDDGELRFELQGDKSLRLVRVARGGCRVRRMGRAGLVRLPLGHLLPNGLPGDLGPLPATRCACTLADGSLIVSLPAALVPERKALVSATAPEGTGSFPARLVQVPARPAQVMPQLAMTTGAAPEDRPPAPEPFRSEAFDVALWRDETIQASGLASVGLALVLPAAACAALGWMAGHMLKVRVAARGKLILSPGPGRRLEAKGPAGLAIELTAPMVRMAGILPGAALAAGRIEGKAVSVTFPEGMVEKPEAVPETSESRPANAGLDRAGPAIRAVAEARMPVPAPERNIPVPLPEAGKPVPPAFREPGVPSSPLPRNLPSPPLKLKREELCGPARTIAKAPPLTRGRLTESEAAKWLRRNGAIIMDIGNGYHVDGHDMTAAEMIETAMKRQARAGVR